MLAARFGSNRPISNWVVKDLNGSLNGFPQEEVSMRYGSIVVFSASFSIFFLSVCLILISPHSLISFVEEGTYTFVLHMAVTATKAELSAAQRQSAFYQLVHVNALARPMVKRGRRRLEEEGLIQLSFSFRFSVCIYRKKTHSLPKSTGSKF